MQLIYLSPVPWNSFAQRPHKFVEWFHAQTGGRVLWVDPYPTRFPALKDFRRLRLRQAPTTVQHSSVPAWLSVLKPSGLPIEPMPGSGWVNGLLWQNHLRAINDFATTSKTLLAIGKPSVFALKLLKCMPDCLSLYDAMDDFPAFYAGFSRSAFARREREIARQVDVVWASSSVLHSRWAKVHDDVRLVQNGLDLSAVQLATQEKPMQASSPKNVLGYIGTIASWFDWEWVCTLAEARPYDEIRLIGPVFERVPDKLPGNINLLPACSHVEALKAMKQFRVGLIPFKKNELTASVDPIKYYEYRALGLPVISTDFGEMKLRVGEQGVFITHFLSDIPVMADSAIQFLEDESDANAFAIQNTWEARFDAAKLLL